MHCGKPPSRGVFHILHIIHIFNPLRGHLFFWTKLPFCAKICYAILLVSEMKNIIPGDFEVFTIYNDNGTDTTLVPNLFIDEYMKNANDAQIKVYLYLIRSMNIQRPASISDIAEEFNHTEREVLRSLRYWEKQGLLNLEYDANGYLAGIHLRSLQPQTAPARGEGTLLPARQSQLSSLQQASGTVPRPAENTQRFRTDYQVRSRSGNISAESFEEKNAVPAKRGAKESGKSSSRKTSKEVIEAFKNNQDRAQLLFIIEQYIGKPLSVNEIQVIYYISEELHFSDSLIDYLLQYCIDRGKKDFRYIEAVAVNWSEKGITTPRQAETAVSPAKKFRNISSPASSSAGRTQKFNQFEQNNYDFDKLEADLLENN